MARLVKSEMLIETQPGREDMCFSIVPVQLEQVIPVIKKVLVFKVDFLAFGVPTTEPDLELA